MTCQYRSHCENQAEVYRFVGRRARLHVCESCAIEIDERQSNYGDEDDDDGFDDDLESRTGMERSLRSQ